MARKSATPKSTSAGTRPRKQAAPRKHPAARKPARKRKQVAGATKSTAGRKVNEQRDVDAAWIQDRLTEQHRSQRQLAEAWGGKSASVVTRVLRNNRELSLREFIVLCNFLGAGPTEVLPRLGYEIPGPPARMTISGAVRGDAQVSFITPRAGRRADVPAPDTAWNVLFVEADSGFMAPYRGAWVLYETADDAAPAVGRLAVVEVEGEIVPVLGTLSRGSKAGQLTLRRFCSAKPEPVKSVLRAHPVRHIVLP